jgi:hyperosmotically inducible periplasmic protein
MKNLTLLAVPMLLLAAQGASSQTLPAEHPSTSPSAPDNTKSNAEDPANRSQSVDRQSNSTAEVDVTKRIRQSIVADKSLSTSGHNVKILSNKGMVTLKGVVRSDDEKTQIADKSAAVGGRDHIVNALKVAPK